MNILHRTRNALAALAVASLLPAASAHEFHAGAIVIEHPYSVPTAAGASNGALYFRMLRNTGDQPDRLLGASTPASSSVVIVGGEIVLPAHGALPVRHDGAPRLTLVGLKSALKNGDRFDVTLRFEHAGEKTVPVMVVMPHAAHVEAQP